MTSYVAPAIGIFGAGLIVGTSLALLFAPKPGTAIRGDLGRSASKLAQRVRTRRSNGHVDMTQLSQDELLQRASALDIDGRLAMTREELITAISNH